MDTATISIDSRSESRSTHKTQLLVRTHIFDNFLDTALARLARETGLSVACVADETRAPIDCRSWPKLSVDTELYESMGLHCPSDFGWRCGDYCLYAARQAYPDASHFWMIEYDVAMRFGNLADFFAGFDNFDHVDFIAPYLGRRLRNWYWHYSVIERYPVAYGCLFPIVRTSARALDHLLATRQADTECRQALREAPEWPNDEAFVASELVTHGFRCRDLNSFGRRIYSKRTFTYDVPIAASDLESRALDGMLYHPVLRGAAFDRKLAQFVAARSGGLDRQLKRRLWLFKWAVVQAWLRQNDRQFWR